MQTVTQIHHLIKLPLWVLAVEEALRLLAAWLRQYRNPAWVAWSSEVAMKTTAAEWGGSSAEKQKERQS